MSRKAKIIIFSVILLFSIYDKQILNVKNDSEEVEYVSEEYNSSNRSPISQDDIEMDNSLKDLKLKLENLPKFENLEDLRLYPSPENGHSPYDSIFGKGVYNNSVSNYVEIDNQTNNDAVVLLVNAYTDQKIRNEYVRKNSNFKMTGIPDGVYYIRMMSGNKWDPYLKLGTLVGGFRENRSISGNSDSKDWMRIGETYADSEGRYYEGFSQTLHPVAGGDVQNESLSVDEFIN